MALLKSAKDLPINHSHRLSLLMAQNILNKIEWKKFLDVSASFSYCCSLPELTPNQVILLPGQQPVMSLTTRGLVLSLCAYKKVRKCPFPKRPDPCWHPQQGRTQGSSGLWGSSRTAEIFLGGQGLGSLCHTNLQPGSAQLGRHRLIAETRLPMWKFIPCELGHWQLNHWVLNSSCSEQRSRLFNLSGF